MQRLAKFSFASLLVASLFGCTGGSRATEPGTRTVLLSDLDGDGLYASAGCAVAPPPPTDPAAGTGSGETDPGGVPTDDCVVLPGPDDCVFIGVTTSVDADGETIPEEETCVQCYDEDGVELGVASCGTVIAPDPVVCTVAGEADGTTVCWECSTPDGEALYTECYTPPTYCEVDEQCAEGEHCALPPTDGGTGTGDVPAGGAAPLYYPQGVCVADGTEPGPLPHEQ